MVKMKNVCIVAFSLLVRCFSPSELTAQCTAPSLSIGSANIYPASATVTVYCTGGNGCLGSTLYLEYGLPGFTPGTGATAGPGGTVMSAPGSNVTVQFNVTGLTPLTAYQVYVRRNCSGTFSPNSPVTSFTTAFDCSQAPVISCNGFNTAVLGSGNGAWITCNNGGPDAIFSFTPSVSGIHRILVKPLPITGCNFSYKAATLGCNSLNWNCLGYASPAGVTQFSFGPLTAGTTYFIKVQQNNLQALNVEFRVECPGCTNALSNINVTGITPYQATISWTGGPAWLEYGPGNFIPGTGSTPGGGALLYGSAGTVTIYNLAPNTGFSFYLRASCNGLTGPNHDRQTFGTAACPAVQTYGVLGSVAYAAPDSRGMFDYPGTNCQFYFAPGNETFYLFSPPATSKYQVTVNYTYWPQGDYLLNYHAASGTCDPSNYLCPVLTSPNPPVNGVSKYEIGPLTGGTGYYLCFDFSDTLYNPSNVLSFHVDCLTPAATITPSGPTTFCNGSQVTLSAPAGAGNSYLWSNGKTTPSITTGNSGNYTVILSNACGSNTSPPVTVTVNPGPSPTITPSGSTSFCSGGSVVLSASSTGGISFQWKKNGNNLPGATTFNYTASASGNYKVVKTNTYGCTGTSAATAVTVYVNPTASVTPQGPTTFCLGDSVELKTPLNNSYSYQWKRNNININGATGNKYQAKTAGNFKVKATTTNGCTALSNTISVAVPCRGEDMAMQDGILFEVVPNPSSSAFAVHILTPIEQPVNIFIYDIFGRMLNREIIYFNTREVTFGAQLPPGMYLIFVENENFKYCQKIIKTH